MRRLREIVVATSRIPQSVGIGYRLTDVNSLYVHIPFCVSKCRYCDFHSIPYERRLSDRYVEALCREIRLHGNKGITLDTVYVGGGTPTALDDGRLKAIISTITTTFDVPDTVEFTVEANPGTLSRSKADLLASLGVNRISIGVQSLNDEDLLRLGRSHSVRDALDAVSVVRAVGFSALSLDLIYGIPNQTVQEWKTVAERALDLRPEHISAYELTPEENTPLGDDLRDGVVSMPDDDDLVNMHEAFVHMAQEGGYEQYEISNFALPGFRCRHNVNYWKRGDYMGVGAGAHSCEGNVRSSNVKSLQDYIDLLSRGLPPTGERSELKREDAEREYIFLGLRMTEGIDLRRLSPAKRSEIKKAVEGLHGLAVIEGDLVRLTRRGMLLSNEVIVRVM